MTQQSHHDASEIICTISLQKTDGAFEQDEADATMHDWLFFLEPYLTKFLIRPGVSKKDNTIFTSSFNCFQEMQETIEAFLYITMKYDQYYRVTAVFDSIDRSLDK